MKKAKALQNIMKNKLSFSMTMTIQGVSPIRSGMVMTERSCKSEVKKSSSSSVSVCST